MDTLTREQFLQYLRDALGHLHNGDCLRSSPLAALFGVADRFDAASALRNVLTQAIDSLKPQGDGLARPHAWWMHQSLFCCYVQHLSQQVVADQLGISARQLRREQRAALEILVDQLWRQYDLEARLGGDAASMDEHPATSPITSDELAWLKNSPPDRTANLNQTLSVILNLAHPLAAQHHVQLRNETPGELPEIAAHPVALNQALLNLITVAIPQTAEGYIAISAKPARGEVTVKVQSTQAPTAARPLSDDEATSLEMARQLVDLCGGKLTLSTDEESFKATLTLPTPGQLPVLVIDDNADTLQLLERYTSNTRYRLITTRDPEQALSLVRESSPRVIVLDVMMPQVDGWRVLAQLQQHPLASRIPVVVCTILTQKALALSLGASGFIRKPVTRQSFLAALDRQLTETESH